jgi:hypothetical protein
MKHKIYNEKQLSIFVENLQKIPLKQGLTIEYKYITKKRSNDQNALYWMWIACICDEIGENSNDLHETLCEKFLPIKEKLIFGITKIERTSTKKLDTIQFKNYLDKIQIFASSELGIILPNPEDRYFEQFKERYEKYL